MRSRLCLTTVHIYSYIRAGACLHCFSPSLRARYRKMILKSALTAVVLCLAVEEAAALDPKCAPGGNFDLSYWNLQLPTGKTGHPATKTPSQLKGCDGYQEPGVFYTDSKDGALVMKVPGSPSSTACVTTPNSKHCRTELRELSFDSGDKASWSPSAPFH